MFPAGPIEVLNMRLKDVGGVRSFPVEGDLTLYLSKRSARSCWE